MQPQPGANSSNQQEQLISLDQKKYQQRYNLDTSDNPIVKYLNKS